MKSEYNTKLFESKTSWGQNIIGNTNKSQYINTKRWGSMCI
jgi:hypothetical protein